jgi:hypothetical protein
MSGKSETKPKPKPLKEIVEIGRQLLVDESRQASLYCEVSLEEAIQEEGVWRLTFGYYPASGNPNQYPVMLGKGPEQFSKLEREFKIMEIRADTGRVVSVKTAEAGKTRKEHHL